MSGDKVFQTLHRCEAELRKLAAEAAEHGDYDTLARLGNTARTISDMASSWQSAAASTDGQASTGKEPAAASGDNITPRTSSTRSAHRAGAGYPRFMRRGNELIKIGWSKKDRKEYQHRAPHELLVALRQAFLDASRRRKLFSMDALERQLAGNGSPGYQAYVWLAWLRSAGLVKQHGRQGYSVVKAATFEHDVDQALAALPMQEP